MHYLDFRLTSASLVLSNDGFSRVGERMCKYNTGVPGIFLATSLIAGSCVAIMYLLFVNLLSIYSFKS